MKEFKGQTVRQEVDVILKKHGLHIEDSGDIFEAVSEVFEMLSKHLEFTEPQAFNTIREFEKMNYTIYGILDDDIMNEMVQG